MNRRDFIAGLAGIPMLGFLRKQEPPAIDSSMPSINECPPYSIPVFINEPETVGYYEPNVTMNWDNPIVGGDSGVWQVYKGDSRKITR